MYDKIHYKKKKKKNLVAVALGGDVWSKEIKMRHSRKRDREKVKSGKGINKLNVDHSGTQFFQDLLRKCEEHVWNFSTNSFFYETFRVLIKNSCAL